MQAGRVEIFSECLVLVFSCGKKLQKSRVEIFSDCLKLVSSLWLKEYVLPWRFLNQLKISFRSIMSQTSDIILREHERLVSLKTKCVDSDVKIICQDGAIRYSRILYYLMEPQYKLLLLDQCLEEEIVIIKPSVSVHEICNFYDQ